MLTMTQPRHTRSTALAVQLMIDELREVCSNVDAHTQALTEAREARNAYIRDVLAGGIPMSRVSRITGLSREQLYRINTTGEPSTVKAE